MEVPFEERNIRNPEFRKQFKEKGYEFLPVIEAGGSIVTDYTGHPQLIEVLHNEGYL
jgi:hypothetical protein